MAGVVVEKKKKARVRSKDTPWIKNKIYCYGAKAPVTEIELFEQELQKGHRYRNALVELERTRRERSNASLLSLPGGERLQRLEAAITKTVEKLRELRAQKRALNSKGRSKATAAPGLTTTIKTLDKRLKALRASYKSARKNLYGSNAWEKGKKERADWFAGEQRRLRKEFSFLAWGIYARIDDEVKLARSKPTPPRFKRGDGSGKVVVQLQGGLSVEDCLAGTDSRLRIRVVEDGIWVPGARKKRPLNPPEGLRLDDDGYPMRRLGDAWVEMRIASRNKKGQLANGGRTPVWCRFPITLHRDLPPKAAIKWAWLRKTRIGPNYSWEFQVVLAEDTSLRAPDTTLATTGVVAIDVGWRLMPEKIASCGFQTKDGVEHAAGCRRSGLRIAFWRGDDGETGELRLSSRWVCAYYKVHDIRSIRDKLFNEHVEALREWMAKQLVPEWLTKETEHIKKWRSPARLAALLGRHWRSNRFDGDGDIYSTLEAWRQRNKHLYCYERHLHDQLQRHRQDSYRKFVANLRSNYATAVIEDIDMRSLAKRKEPEDSHLEKDAARKNRTGAAISVLRSALGERMQLTKVNPAGTSYLCNGCGASSFRGQTATVLTCVHCGYSADRDDNACKNILERGLEKIASKPASRSEVA